MLGISFPHSENLLIVPRKVPDLESNNLFFKWVTASCHVMSNSLDTICDTEHIALYNPPKHCEKNAYLWHLRITFNLGVLNILTMQGNSAVRPSFINAVAKGQLFNWCFTVMCQHSFLTYNYIFFWELQFQVH